MVGIVLMLVLVSWGRPAEPAIRMPFAPSTTDAEALGRVSSLAATSGSPVSRNARRAAPGSGQRGNGFRKAPMDEPGPLLGHCFIDGPCPKAPELPIKSVGCPNSPPDGWEEISRRCLR